MAAVALKLFSVFFGSSSAVPLPLLHSLTSLSQVNTESLIVLRTLTILIDLKKNHMSSGTSRQPLTRRQRSFRQFFEIKKVLKAIKGTMLAENCKFGTHLTQASDSKRKCIPTES